ncbi:hypothetical protein KY360_01505 [Candidatus Woesearchaeota archaeon]|nr:hypothetical protein [Candidatus Woesearchaeota archaeon]
MDDKIGKYAFIIGVVLAVILGLAIPGLAAASGWLLSLLVILGLVVGYLNVAGKATKDFLLIATILVIVSSMGGTATILGSVQVIGKYLQGILNSIMAFVVPAVIVVGLKAVYAMAKQ